MIKDSICLSNIFYFSCISSSELENFQKWVLALHIKQLNPLLCSLSSFLYFSQNWFKIVIFVKTIVPNFLVVEFYLKQMVCDVDWSMKHQFSLRNRVKLFCEVDFCPFLRKFIIVGFYSYFIKEVKRNLNGEELVRESFWKLLFIVHDKQTRKIIC